MIVGNSEKQVKFSELTLDMFRMLQALEREPEEYQPYILENSADFTGDQVMKDENVTHWDGSLKRFLQSFKT